MLHALSYIEETKLFDDRILAVIKQLNQQNNAPIKINALASKVFISSYRLIHLSTDQVGIPIRKYLLLRKLLLALQEMITTKNITQAALAGGFSNTAQFNRTFKR